MVQAIINIEDQTNRVLNIVKAKFGLKDKTAHEAVMKKVNEIVNSDDVNTIKI